MFELATMLIKSLIRAAVSQPTYLRRRRLWREVAVEKA
jgi:hypothetical protein